MSNAQTFPKSAVSVFNYMRIHWFRVLAWSSIAVYTADTIYRSVYGITYETRQNCVLYKNTPRWFFMLYEHVIELFMMVIIGVLIAALVEKYFKKIHPVFPDNSFIAFVFASVLPVCSCTAIPLVKALDDKVSYRTIVTFLVAAPLISPYILLLTYNLLGLKYMLIRIASSFIMAYGAGVIMERLHSKPAVPAMPFSCAGAKACSYRQDDVWANAQSVFLQIIYYICIAGALSLSFELLSPLKVIESIPVDFGIFSTLAVVALGMPIYLCNGADVLVLKPIITYTDIGFGTAMAFSLTSSAICISSIILLAKFIGIRHVISLTLLISGAAVMLGTVLNAFPAVGF